jgi:hypothetical protein
MTKAETPLRGWSRKFADGEPVLLGKKYMGAGVPMRRDVPAEVVRIDGVTCWRQGRISHAIYYIREVESGEIYPTCEDELKRRPRP